MVEISVTRLRVSRVVVACERIWESLARRHGCEEIWTDILSVWSVLCEKECVDVCVSLVSGGSGVVVVIWTQGEVYRVGRMLGVRGFFIQTTCSVTFLLGFLCSAYEMI